MQYRITLAALLTISCLFSGAIPAEIYRSVDADGVVTYSDQPSSGAVEVKTVSSEPGTQASAVSAQAAAQARIDSELALAERLAADRRERSAERQTRALVRAELRESKAREQSLAVEQEAAAERQHYDGLGYFPDYAPYYPRRNRHGRHDRSPDHDGYGRYSREQHFEPPLVREEPRLRSRLPRD